MLTPKGFINQWAALIAGDISVAAGSTYAAAATVEWLESGAAASLPLPEVAALLAAGSVLACYLSDLYKFDQPYSRWRILRAVACAQLVLAIMVPIILFANPEVVLARRFFLSYIMISSPTMLVWRLAAAHALATKIRIGVAILGVGDEAAMIADEVQRHQHLGYRLLEFGALNKDIRRKVDLSHLSGDQDVHSISTNMDLIDAYKPKILVLLGDHLSNWKVRELVRCRLHGVQVLDVGSFYEHLTGKLLLSFLCESWLLQVPGFAGSELRHNLKRVADIVASLVVGFIALPFAILTAVAIKLDSPGPILYWQDRVGLDGNVFRLYKFRSMRVDAESDMGAVWASRADPRMTRVGRIIRRFRIDELPQLINVIRKDMSLVGPRPERPEIVAKLNETIQFYDYRHLLRPGLTGWAQVCYPYGATLEDAGEKLAYDLYYLKNWSLRLDLQIVLQTIKVVLFGRGAR